MLKTVLTIFMVLFGSQAFAIQLTYVKACQQELVKVKELELTSTKTRRVCRCIRTELGKVPNINNRLLREVAQFRSRYGYSSTQRISVHERLDLLLEHESDLIMECTAPGKY